MKIQDIGEQGLLTILQRFCPQEIVGDDAAVITTQADRSLTITTDMLVDGVHFSDRTTKPSDAGWRAAAANLSDLAAMGATPLAVTVALGITGNTDVEWVEEFYRGMVACLQQYHTPIVGGDIVRSPAVTVAITAFGEVEHHRTIRRGNAVAGWLIVATGVHGASRAGLELLLDSKLGQNLSAVDRTSLILAHQRPIPRLDVLPVLWEILDAANAKIAIAGMDSSDGLADAIVQICRMSKVGARIERSRVLIPRAIEQIVSPQTALNWALYGGEDFELVLCLPSDLAEKLVQRLGTSSAIVGEITDGSEILLIDNTGIYADEKLAIAKGFQHF
ncbi:MAG: thiamine-phosphate kinase [Microcoleus sp.]